jgi:hypothetical protein
MARTFTPKPAALSGAELAAVRCDVRAGDGLDHAMAERLLLTIDEYHQALLAKANRLEVEPGQIGARVTSQVPGIPEEIGRPANAGGRRA